MHTLHSIVAIFGLLLMTVSCSSGVDEAQPLPIGTSGSDAAFSYYDKDGSVFVEAKEIYLGEKDFGGTRITSQGIAEQVIADYDFDGDGRLDHLEFTGLVNAKVLAGVLYHAEWSAPAGH